MSYRFIKFGPLKDISNRCMNLLLIHTWPGRVSKIREGRIRFQGKTVSADGSVVDAECGVFNVSEVDLTKYFALLQHVDQSVRVRREQTQNSFHLNRSVVKRLGAFQFDEHDGFGAADATKETGI